MTGDPGSAVLPTLPRDDGGPVFAEPWQAQAFAMAVRLHEQGHFEWSEWAAELSRQIAAAGPDDAQDYYLHWLGTLEVMVTSRGLSSDVELAERRNRVAACRRGDPPRPTDRPRRLIDP